MADSPMNKSVSRVALSVLVDGQELKEEYMVDRILIDKEVGKIPYAQVVLLDGDPAKGSFPVSEADELAPGSSVKIKLGFGTEEEDVFEGVITGQTLRAVNYEHKKISQLVLTCKDKAFKMDVIPKTAQYDEMKDSEVLSSILGDYSVAGTVTATEFKHNRLVQFQTTDWEFVLQRANVNGLFVICDAGKVNIEEPELSGEEVLTLDYGSSILDFQAELRSDHQIKKSSVQGWKDAEQKTEEGESSEPTSLDAGNQTGEELAKVSDSPELKLASSAPEDKTVMKDIADAVMLRSRLSIIHGTVSFVGSSKVEPGKLIALEGMGDRFNGKAYVRKVRHEVERGFWKTEVGFGLDYEPKRLSRLTMSASAIGGFTELPGLQLGKVKQIHEDPDGGYRVLVDVPSIKKDGTGIWARLNAGFASNAYGFFFFPDVDDEVIVGFLGGDPRFPIVLGSLYSKKNTPPFEPSEENNEKGIILKSDMKLTFDEEEMLITLETPEGQKVILNDKEKSITLEDGNKNKVELTDAGITLDSAKDLKISSKGSVTITGQSDVSIESKGGDVNLKGLNVASKASVGFKAEGSATAELKASGNVVVKGAMVNIN